MVEGVRDDAAGVQRVDVDTVGTGSGGMHQPEPRSRRGDLLRAAPGDQHLRAGHQRGDIGATADRLDDLLSTADVVVVSAPLTPETEGMIGAAELRSMKDTAVLVNVGRGPLVAERPLYEALRDGVIGGAAIDVWYGYPAPGSSRAEPSELPFRELDNVLMTPHSSGLTHQTFAGRAAGIGANVHRLAAGEDLRNVVAVAR